MLEAIVPLMKHATAFQVTPADAEGGLMCPPGTTPKTVLVELRDKKKDLWSITADGHCWAKNGEGWQWEPEPRPSERDSAWKERTRFKLGVCLAILGRLDLMEWPWPRDWNPNTEPAPPLWIMSREHYERHLKVLENMVDVLIDDVKKPDNKRVVYQTLFHVIKFMGQCHGILGELPVNFKPPTELSIKLSHCQYLAERYLMHDEVYVEKPK
jgi:hypothetical protein